MDDKIILEGFSSFLDKTSTIVFSLPILYSTLKYTQAIYSTTLVEKVVVGKEIADRVVLKGLPSFLDNASAIFSPSLLHTLLWNHTQVV